MLKWRSPVYDVLWSLGRQMEGDPPAGVGPGFLKQPQMYSISMTNTAAITSYQQLLQQFESFQQF